MDLKGIIAISGISGLSKLIAKTKNGIVCESLVDKKRFPVQGSDKVSALEDISIYTDEGEKPLREVFALIKQKEKGNPVSVDLKGDVKKMREYFEEVLPNFDRERVYNSDIKKLLNWYNILLANNLLNEIEEIEPAVKENSEEVKKPVRKAAAKKTKSSVDESVKEPAKKAVKKAKAETHESKADSPQKPAKKAAAKKAKKTGE